MAAEHQYFYEDEVYRVNKKGHIEFGMVLENAELVSSDDNSDNDESGKMKKGHIRVAWHPTGVEEVVSERKVGLADRSLMPGDVVRRMIKGKDTQRGYCRHMEVSASVQIVGTKHIINYVKSKDLIPIEALAPDIAVCLDSWVGGIKLVHTKLHLSLPDNSRCVVTDPETSGFDIFDEKKDPDSDFPHRGYHYPGQVLWGPLSVLEEIAEWTQPSKDLKALKSKMNRTIKVTVDDVEIESVGIHWQCRAYSKDGAGTEKEQPKVHIQGDDIKRLKLLNVFEPCTLQVGDRNVYILKSCDFITTKDQWRKEQKRLILKEHSTPLRLKRKRTGTPSAFYQKKEDAKEKGEEKPKAKENGFESLDKHKKELNNVEINNLENNQDADESSDCESETGSNASSSATSVVSNPSSKKAPSLPIRTLTKVLHKKKLRRTSQRKPVRPVSLTPGSKVIVETVSTQSVADVVWQDGSVELGIPSRELYPIHHLDDQEFFPGDFVIENREEACMRVYGVIQNVDHAGRTAAVKWFKTYTSAENPQPTLLMESEMSVYDLKDHPDFQYRPGTVVIRVANFQGEDEACTAGQVLDNYPEGLVRVWWVEGHISMCWPQDLYKVGEYDSDEGELWDDGTSDDGSWQTESEDCCTCPEDNVEEPNDESLKPKLAANIEKARIAMSRLEEIFTQNPSLQTTDVMRKLLEVYKDCRYLDKLMGTMFFHESHFQGLLERVRERGRTNVAQRVADQVQRLFNQCSKSGIRDKEEADAEGMEVSEDDSLPFVYDKVAVSAVKQALVKTAKENWKRLWTNSTKDPEEKTSNGSGVTTGTMTEQESSDEKSKRDSSGEFLTGSLASLEARVTKAVVVVGMSDGICNAHVCTKLCSLLLAQLVKAHAEVIRRFGGSSSSMTEANNVSPSNSAIDNKHEPKGGTTEIIKNPDELINSSAPVAICPEVNGVPPTPIPEPQEEGTFMICDTAPNSHKYKLTMFQPTDTRLFYKRVREEIKLLRSSLPPGIWVAAFEDRMVYPITKFSFTMDNLGTPAYNMRSKSVGATMLEREVIPPSEAETITDPMGHSTHINIGDESFTESDESENVSANTHLGSVIQGIDDMDLFSVMIRGPEKTPYEDGLFFFDFQLSADYPKAPPHCHYISYCSDRLNPNLYEDGKVCVSLLGTWSGKGTEVWTSTSTLLQVLVSIQGLILVHEPYFNEAGYEKQKGTQQGKENSRMYNEMVVLKLVQSMAKLVVNPPVAFKDEVSDHFAKHAIKLSERLESWLDISEKYNNSHPLSPTTPTTYKQIHNEGVALPEFPLIPASKGFCLTLRKTLVYFRQVLAQSQQRSLQESQSS